MRRMTLTVVLLIVIVVLGFGIFNDVRITQAAEKNSIADVMLKLDKVIKNQEKIFERFDEVMKELGIVKIRASR